MDLRINKNTLIVFDLDDTLYNEVDFLYSAYRTIAQIIYKDNSNSFQLHSQMISWYHDKIDVFDKLITEYELQIEKSKLLNTYRTHFPRIELFTDAKQFILNLDENGIDMAIITDGRSITQRNKIQALGLTKYLKHIVISEEVNSEKPNLSNFNRLHSSNYDNYVYIADNPKKDFFAPNVLGWTSICLIDNGRNIHKQNFDIPNDYQPKYKITSFKEIIIIYEH